MIRVAPLRRIRFDSRRIKKGSDFMTKDGRPYAESCDYNKFPIGDVFRKILPTTASLAVLELGSGTGQHAQYFTEVFPQIKLWQPTDYATEHAGIVLWTAGCPTVKPPLALAFEDPAETWVSTVHAEVGLYDVAFTANTFHIASWDDCLACMTKLPLVVKPGGAFVIYGPFNYGGKFTTDSNARFDEWLKVHRSPKSGIRNFEDVVERMAAAGFALEEDHEMPENNRCIVFRRT